MDPFSLGVLSSLVAAGIGAAVAYIVRDSQYKKRLSCAPSKYAEKLGGLIEAAYNEGLERVEINAQAIVSLRNEMRDRLISVATILNSEITMLQAILFDDFKALDAENSMKSLLSTKDRKLSKADKQKLFTQIEVLRKTWPQRREILEIEIRKLLAELGLEREPPIWEKTP